MNLKRSRLYLTVFANVPWGFCENARPKNTPLELNSTYCDILCTPIVSAYWSLYHVSQYVVAITHLPGFFAVKCQSRVEYIEKLSIGCFFLSEYVFRTFVYTLNNFTLW